MQSDHFPTGPANESWIVGTRSTLFDPVKTKRPGTRLRSTAIFKGGKDCGDPLYLVQDDAFGEIGDKSHRVGLGGRRVHRRHRR